MKEIIKKLDKKWLAVYVPLAVAGYALSGLTTLGKISLALGAVYLGWQVYDAAGR